MNTKDIVILIGFVVTIVLLGIMLYQVVFKKKEGFYIDDVPVKFQNGSVALFSGGR